MSHFWGAGRGHSHRVSEGGASWVRLSGCQVSPKPRPQVLSHSSDSTCLQDSRAHQSLRARYSEVKVIAQTWNEWGVERPSMVAWKCDGGGGPGGGHTGIDFSMQMFSTCRRRLFHFVSSLLPALPMPVTPRPICTLSSAWQPSPLQGLRHSALFALRSLFPNNLPFCFF